MSTALVPAVPAADNGDMVLLVMLPTDDQVMIIQTTRGKTIAELEEYIVAEYARVFPKKAALPRNVRIQKCVPMSLVLNRRKRSHDQFQGKQQQNKDQHCFVELSKTVQVGNVFEAMEQIYVVTNTGKEASPPQIQAHPNKPLAITNGTEQPADAKKKKNKNKKVAATGAVDKPTQQQQQPKEKPQQKKEQAKKQEQPKKQEQAKKQEQPKKQEQAKKQEQNKTPSVPVMKSTATPVSAPQATAIPEVEAAEVATTEATNEPEVPVKAKRGRKAKVAVDTPVVVVTQPEPTAPATYEPPAKKVKVAAPAKETPALVEETSTETPTAAAVETIEAPVKAKRGRKPAAQTPVKPTPVTSEAPTKGRKKKQPATALDADQAPPAAKRAKTAAASKTTEAEAADDKPAPKRLGRPPKVKEPVVPVETPVEASTVAEPASLKPVRLSIQETIASLRERIAAEKAAKGSESTEEAAPANVASTKSVAATATETAVKAKTTKEASATKAAKEPKATKATKAAKEAAVAADVTAQVEPAAKRSFSDILAQTRARLSAEKQKQNVIKEDGSDDETTDSSVTASGKTATTAKAVTKAAPVQIETHDSATSSDSDFEDKPKKTTPKKATPTKKPTPKAAPASSDDSTDDEELDYSQSLLADLTKSDPVTPQKTVSHVMPQSTVSTPTEQPPRVRGRPRKTKVVLPTDDADIAPESSQETATDLSQDLLSQKNPESNSVLVSSLSKNRFSLDNIPVAKLKKTSKNPFATTTTGKDAAPAPAKRGPGRPRKIKE